MFSSSARLGALGMLAGLATAAFGTTDPARAEASSGTTVFVGDIRIERAWTRQPPPGASAGGGYARVVNEGTVQDRLVGGSVSFAERFEIHEMAVRDGVMRMRELDDGILIEPGETVDLEPGGFHFMFVELTAPPVEGSTVPVTLRFEKAGEVVVQMPVAPVGAGSPFGEKGE